VATLVLVLELVLEMGLELAMLELVLELEKLELVAATLLAFLAAAMLELVVTMAGPVYLLEPVESDLVMTR